MIDKDKRWKFWIGVLLGVIFISIGRFPSGWGLGSYPLMLLCGLIAGFIAGSVREGAKAGLLAVLIGLIIRGLILLRSTPAPLPSASLYIGGILDAVLIIVIPVVAFAVIGGWICQLVNKQVESVKDRTKES